MTTENGILPFKKPEAEKETAEAKRMTVDLGTKLHRLKQYSAHTALGYATWREYVETEFGMTYRRSKQLTDFFEIVSSIAEQTGIANPPLNEKDMRGIKPEDMDRIVDAAEQAKQNGEDPRDAIKEVARKCKEHREAKSVKTASNDSKPTGNQTINSTATGDDSIKESTSAEQDLRDGIEDRDSTPDNDTATEPTPLPVQMTWTYDSWMKLTLACRDSEGLRLMREHFTALAKKVAFEIRTKEDYPEAS